jgi:DNA-binding NarL/FixJ family response regulator
MMAAVAIYSTDATMRDRLRQRFRGTPKIAVAGMVSDLSALAQLVETAQIDAILADAPSREQLNDWHLRHPGTPIIVLVDGADVDEALEALCAGAAAILPRSAVQTDIAVAIEGAINGLAILPRDLLDALLDPKLPEAAAPIEPGARIALTPRELEVLAAMADGASNKAIARRLGISFHTVKFHVAAILAKLDADSRTEAVAKAAHLGLVML